MILARLSRAVREQNWFAVVLEFFIVIVGVVIAFQVTAWNEARQDRADEARFLLRLHSDIELAESLSQRVRERRLERIDDIVGAIDILFGRTDATELSQAQCSSLASSNFFDINTADLAAFSELAGAGRIGIIRDDELRRNLIQYQQVRASLRDLITVRASDGIALPQVFPDLISMDARYDSKSSEVRATISCDLSGMRVNRHFLNAASANADGYDAYVRDGLQPWSDQLSRLHEQIDRILGIDHTDEDSL